MERTQQILKKLKRGKKRFHITGICNYRDEFYLICWLQKQGYEVMNNKIRVITSVNKNPDLEGVHDFMCYTTEIELIKESDNIHPFQKFIGNKKRIER